MGEPATHPAWKDRVDFYQDQLVGQWNWSMRSATTAVVVDHEGNPVAAVLPDLAPGIVAALNTIEGRAAYGRARLDG